MVENEPPPGAVKRGQARCGPLSGRICAIALQAIRRYRFRRDRHHLVSFLYYVSICIVIHDTTKYITSPHFLSKVQHAGPHRSEGRVPNWPIKSPASAWKTPPP